MTDKLKNMVDLMGEQLKAFQRGAGHIYSDTKNLQSLNRFDAPTRTEIQKEINHIVQGSLLVYLFAMWDEYGTRDLEGRLTNDDQTRMDAFRHVRHSAAHGFKGTRAKDNKKLSNAFETIMRSKNPLNVGWDEDEDTIDLSQSSVAYACHEFMSASTKKILVSLVGHGATTSTDL